MRERSICDRNGGVKARYLRRPGWRCPRCHEVSEWNGHICGECHRRVCCECFHHDMGICLTAPGSDVDDRCRVKTRCPGRED